MNVILGNDGVLYGTTEFNGGIYQDMIYDGGEVFKVNTDGSGFMVLHTFATLMATGRNRSRRWCKPAIGCFTAQQNKAPRVTTTAPCSN